MKVALTVRDFLERANFVYPDATAVVDEPGVPGALGSITYAQMFRGALSLAHSLREMGIKPGDRVAIVSPNSGKFLISFFGVSGYGRILVPVNYRLNPEEVSYIIEHSGARVLLLDPEYVETFAGVKAEFRIVMDGVEDKELFDLATEHDPPDDFEPDEDGTCSINYTSGTTARPKGVELTHRNCWLNAAVLGWNTGIKESDVYLHTLPMFHCNGWGMPYAVTSMGVCQVVQRKIDGEQILQRIEARSVTSMCAAPAVLNAVLDAASKRTQSGTPTPGRDQVRVVVAGAPPPSKTIERVETELGWEFIQIYGLTETSPLLTINRREAQRGKEDPSERSRKLSQAGKPALGVRIKIDEDGEVLARSNHVFKGYYHQPEETAKAFEGGWFHTGDGGYFDGSSLVITDRKKDVIITGGENVSSVEVEDCLYQHPAVAEAAVIGVPDEKWGETVKALVVLKEGSSATERDIIEFCRERLSHFKCPTSVEFRDALPRTATGKLQKFKMRQPYWEGHERHVN
jgi:fatty-acyl-CoA synthase